MVGPSAKGSCRLISEDVWKDIVQYFCHIYILRSKLHIIIAVGDHAAVQGYHSYKNSVKSGSVPTE